MGIYKIILRLMAVAAFAAAFALAGTAENPAYAFEGPGCMGECADCHTLKKEEAATLLKTESFKAEVRNIRMGPVKGLWEVEIARGDKNFIVYMDFAKKFLIENVRFTALESIGKPPALEKVDLSTIPLKKAIVFGDPKAKKRVIIFDDPDCPYCASLHDEVKKIMNERKDIAFYIKLFPLPIHPEAYSKSKTIVCKASGELLEKAFRGEAIPEPDCETAEIDDNIRLAKELGIRGTPSIILPDGRLLPGYVSAEALLNLIDNPE